MSKSLVTPKVFSLKVFIKYVILRVLRTTPLGPLITYDFSEFLPPSSILAENESVVYLKNRNRYKEGFWAI